MNRTVSPLLIAIAATALALLSVGRVAASDETADVEVRIHAALTATDCGAVPPTVTVLGLRIDVSAAAIGAENIGAVACGALVDGQPVEVKLASDILDALSGLPTATVVEQGGGNAVTVQAPIQAFDETAMTVTLLGVAVDVSAAALHGAGDDPSDNNWHPIPVSFLMVGQSAEMALDPLRLPNLVATVVEVKNVTNEVEVELTDTDGDEVYDEEEDVDVSVEETVVVRNLSPLATRRTKRLKRILHFYMSAHGSFILSGLPTGSAKILVVRTTGGVTTVGHRRVRVKPDELREVRIRLRAPRR
jgi:hypothetical protein